MEFMAGGNLKEYLAQHRPTLYDTSMFTFEPCCHGGFAIPNQPDLAG
jgi:hypothetical protein